MTELWYGEMPTGAGPIIRLLPAGLSSSTWTNVGTEGGQFTAPGGDVNAPVVETVDGRTAVTFDSNDFMVWNKLAPASITGNSDWTVIIEAWDDEVAVEGWIIGWARRETEPNYAAIGYGSHADWGAAAHWAAAVTSLASQIFSVLASEAFTIPSTTIVSTPSVPPS